jgi:1-acyl-sn-glycerol-3-phosphate acyltransferase
LHRGVAAKHRPETIASLARSIAFTLFQLVVTPPYALMVVLLFWLPARARFAVIIGWNRVHLWAARVLCGIGYRVVGAEHIPAQPCIVMSKHSSTWETLALCTLFNPGAYVAKKELLRIPFFGWAFALASPITIDRSAGQTAMQQIAGQGRERIRQGFWIIVYPEGTRIRAGQRGRYKSGGARLACDLGLPIVPVAHNAGYLWPKGIFGKKPGTITLSVGEPISTAGRDAQSISAEVENWIESEVSRLGVPGEDAAPTAR